jgi:hypothetical protein
MFSLLALLLVGTQATFAQGAPNAKRGQRVQLGAANNANAKAKVAIALPNSFMVVRVDDSVRNVFTGALVNPGTTLRLEDSLEFLTVHAQMTVMNKAQGRFLILHNNGRRDDSTRRYKGRVSYLMMPAIRRPNTPSLMTGVFDMPPPMPPVWTTEILRDRLWGKLSPQRLAVMDSVVVDVRSAGYKLNDNAFFFARVFNEGRQAAHRFPSAPEGFVINKNAFARSLDTLPLGMMPPCEISFRKEDGGDRIFAGCTLVFPDPSAVVAEFRLIIDALKGQKPEMVRTELYYYFHNTYGMIDGKSFNDILQKNFAL